MGGGRRVAGEAVAGAVKALVSVRAPSQGVVGLLGTGKHLVLIGSGLGSKLHVLLNLLPPKHQMDFKTSCQLYNNGNCLPTACTTGHSCRCEQLTQLPNDGQLCTSGHALPIIHVYKESRALSKKKKGFVDHTSSLQTQSEDLS